MRIKFYVYLISWLAVICDKTIAGSTNGSPVTVVSSAANDQFAGRRPADCFLSDRSGQPNIWLRDLRNGADKQRTFNPEGFLKSYVYFTAAAHSRRPICRVIVAP